MVDGFEVYRGLGFNLILHDPFTKGIMSFFLGFSQLDGAASGFSWRISAPRMIMPIATRASIIST